MGAVLCGAVRTRIFGQSAVRCGAMTLFLELGAVLCGAWKKNSFWVRC